MPRKNRDDNLAYAKTYRATHAEQIKRDSAKYYLDHKAEINAKHQAAYAAKRASILEKRAPKRAEAAAWQAAYRAANPDIVREMSQRKRARKLQAPINDLTAAEWREIKDAYKHRCVYCGRKMQKLTRII